MKRKKELGERGDQRTVGEGKEEKESLIKEKERAGEE